MKENRISAGINIDEDTKEVSLPLVQKLNNIPYILFRGGRKVTSKKGDKFAHAQSCYYDKPLVDECGNYLIKL